MGRQTSRVIDKKRGDEWTKVVLERSINALDWLEKKFGNYSYPQITTTDRKKKWGNGISNVGYEWA
ncbi:hypothetical protein Ct9H90mP12_2800 [bacterium]|nr:MAG: hypothetical protein Ct9H90mP12_2800 [bacterium]